MKKITRTITKATYDITVVNKITLAIQTHSITILDIEDDTNLAKFVQNYVDENCTNCIVVKYEQTEKICHKYAMDIDKFVENAEILE